MHADGDENEREVAVDVGGHRLVGALGVPTAANGVIAFAHGRGSSRQSPRNRQVARVLRARGLATLLLDLLDEGEADDHLLAFNINVLAERMVRVIDWLQTDLATRDLPIGLFGSSTGAPAAIVAAAELPDRVRAFVSRGGRPDLAGECLKAVACPSLFIVGGADDVVLELNRWAFDRLHCPKQLVVVPGASHLFAETGALEEVSRLAADWFTQHLSLHGRPITH